ncbi:MAG TPA: DOMON-like domain-containing protein [Allosphingosinicella sp.]
MEVDLIVSADHLLISYFVGGTEDLIVPEPAAGDRRDGLWETTCFEAFLKPEGSEGYFEFNFSPSTDWAAYEFERYREGRSDLRRPVDPFSTRGEEPSGPLLEVDLDLSGLPHGALRLGLCAVVEERGGVKSYWALAHPPGDPDFHHPSCFALELPAAI